MKSYVITAATDLGTRCPPLSPEPERLLDTQRTIEKRLPMIKRPDITCRQSSCLETSRCEKTLELAYCSGRSVCHSDQRQADSSAPLYPTRKLCSSHASAEIKGDYDEELSDCVSSHSVYRQKTAIQQLHTRRRNNACLKKMKYSQRVPSVETRFRQNVKHAPIGPSTSSYLLHSNPFCSQAPSSSGSDDSMSPRLRMYSKKKELIWSKEDDGIDRSNSGLSMTRNHVEKGLRKQLKTVSSEAQDAAVAQIGCSLAEKASHRDRMNTNQPRRPKWMKLFPTWPIKTSSKSPQPDSCFDSTAHTAQTAYTGTPLSTISRVCSSNASQDKVEQKRPVKITEVQETETQLNISDAVMSAQSPLSSTAQPQQQPAHYLRLLLSFFFRRQEHRTKRSSLKEEEITKHKSNSGQPSRSTCSSTCRNLERSKGHCTSKRAEDSPIQLQSTSTKPPATLPRGWRKSTGEPTRFEAYGNESYARLNNTMLTQPLVTKHAAGREFPLYQSAKKEWKQVPTCRSRSVKTENLINGLYIPGLRLALTPRRRPAIPKNQKVPVVDGLSGERCAAYQTSLRQKLDGPNVFASTPCWRYHGCLKNHEKDLNVLATRRRHGSYAKPKMLSPKENRIKEMESCSAGARSKRYSDRPELLVNHTGRASSDKTSLWLPPKKKQLGSGARLQRRRTLYDPRTRHLLRVGVREPNTRSRHDPRYNSAVQYAVEHSWESPTHQLGQRYWSHVASRISLSNDNERFTQRNSNVSSNKRRQVLDTSRTSPHQLLKPVRCQETKPRASEVDPSACRWRGVSGESENSSRAKSVSRRKEGFKKAGRNNKLRAFYVPYRIAPLGTEDMQPKARNVLPDTSFSNANKEAESLNPTATNIRSRKCVSERLNLGENVKYTRQCVDQRASGIFSTRKSTSVWFQQKESLSIRALVSPHRTDNIRTHSSLRSQKELSTDIAIASRDALLDVQNFLRSSLRFSKHSRKRLVAALRVAGHDGFHESKNKLIRYPYSLAAATQAVKDVSKFPPLMIALPNRRADVDFTDFGYEQIHILSYGPNGHTHVVRCTEDNELWVAKVVDLTRLTHGEAALAKLEAEYLERLRHPFILRFKESFKTDIALVIITEYCRGGDLFSRVERAAAAEGQNLLSESRKREKRALSYPCVTTLNPKLLLCRSSQRDLSLNSPQDTTFLGEEEPCCNNYTAAEHDTDVDSSWHSDEEDNIPPPLIVKWITQLALGLQYMHSQKILHCDLKSSNIFLTEDGTAKIGDLGIAREMGGAVFSRGTPSYMSPEICHGSEVTDKADSWALGCILYEMVFKRHAFEEIPGELTTWTISSAVGKVSQEIERRLPHIRAEIKALGVLSGAHVASSASSPINHREINSNNKLPLRNENRSFTVPQFAISPLQELRLQRVASDTEVSKVLYTRKECSERTLDDSNRKASSEIRPLLFSAEAVLSEPASARQYLRHESDDSDTQTIPAEHSVAVDDGASKNSGEDGALAADPMGRYGHFHNPLSQQVALPFLHGGGPLKKSRNASKTPCERFCCSARQPSQRGDITSRNGDSVPLSCPASPLLMSPVSTPLSCSVTSQHTPHYRSRHTATRFSIRLIYHLLSALLQHDPEDRPSLQHVLEMLYSAEYLEDVDDNASATTTKAKEEPCNNAKTAFEKKCKLSVQTPPSEMSPAAALPEDRSNCLSLQETPDMTLSTVNNRATLESNSPAQPQEDDCVSSAQLYVKPTPKGHLFAPMPSLPTCTQYTAATLSFSSQEDGCTRFLASESCTTRRSLDVLSPPFLQETPHGSRATQSATISCVVPQETPHRTPHPAKSARQRRCVSKGLVSPQLHAIARHFHELPQRQMRLIHRQQPRRKLVHF